MNFIWISPLAEAHPYDVSPTLCGRLVHNGIKRGVKSNTWVVLVSNRTVHSAYRIANPKVDNNITKSIFILRCYM